MQYILDLEEAYDRIDWRALWVVLKMYGVGGKQLNGVKAFYKDVDSCIKVNVKMSDSFEM